MKSVQKFSAYLQAPIHGHVLGLFRLVFGAFMVYEMLDYVQIDLVRNAFILPKIHLSYFDWLTPPAEGLLDAMLWVMLLSAVLMMLGVLFRPACLLLGTFYAYFFFLDKALFNNHLYLFWMLCFLFATTHADRFISLRNFFDKTPTADLRVQRWEVFIFQLIFAIVYFYGGLAKINPDWLIRMEPMREMVNKLPPGHYMAPLLKQDFMVPFLTYAGIIFDLAVPFLLWNKKTRNWSLIAILFFHGSNTNIFWDIGIFPFTMIASTVLFYDTAELPLLRSFVKNRPNPAKPLLLPSPLWVKKALVAYFVFQLLFPFRGLFLPNPVNWTMIANRFSWRMKCQSRFPEQVAFTIQEGPTGQPIPVELDKFINPMQINVVAHDVVAVADVAKALAAEGKQQGMVSPIVKADIRVRWNGYPVQPTVDPTVDLSKVEVSPFSKVEWAMPMPGSN